MLPVKAEENADKKQKMPWGLGVGVDDTHFDQLFSPGLPNLNTPFAHKAKIEKKLRTSPSFGTILNNPGTRPSHLQGL